MHPNLHGLCTLPTAYLCAVTSSEYACKWLGAAITAYRVQLRIVSLKHMAFVAWEPRMSPSKPLYAHIAKRRFAIGWCVCRQLIPFKMDQNGPMLRIIGVDSHADCSNITEAWMDRWILRSRRVEKGRVGHHRCQVKTIWCRYDLADSCSQTMGHYRGACGEMVGNGWNFTWPHLAIQNNYCIFLSNEIFGFLDFRAASCKPKATGCTPREWQDVQPLIPALGRPQLGKVCVDRPSFAEI